MTSGIIDHRAKKLRRQLADRLEADGAVTSPAWGTAFAEVPRHVFVPVFYKQSPTDQRAVDLSSPDEWLDGVYRDELLVIRPDARSSSTVPGLMATMLEALAVEDGHKVLEIGTGSGYNAALLSHRLGDSKVVTMDIDPELVADATARLDAINYHPTLGVGDGLAGWPARALYDRLIATCAPDKVPKAWLEQIRPGGRIVTPIATGIAVLDVTGPREASGHFLPGAAYFMPLRAGQRPPDVGAMIDAVKRSTESGRETSTSPDVWFDGDFSFLRAAAVPGVRFLAKLDNGTAVFTHPDGSWASVADSVVVQSGPRHLWNLVEGAHRTWLELGCPKRDRFLLTVDGPQQQISLAGSDQEWELP
ncbi:protein-L-isoaspartate(D-aspartate) O-methyltransferase [Kribbella qitaiheensis]|uniref:Protein-L-isoaspartate O-methyltransferase n=1 Tax=Kribbella qitaiheensis TaxID=1544730 RepID=A0A7G6X7Z9_9ACTN|nr:methyltransferase domain-containing protein [Kribbella qitaiheensis]QNE22364.1 protein-L-isoaspartate(D-aspartate) O-methyltransferase [Kribbella qitaiheensis]